MIDPAAITHEIRLGDCLDPISGLASLPDKSCDHVICDPLYEAEAHTRGRRIKAGKGTVRGVREAPLPFAAITSEERVAFSLEAVRICRGWLLVFGQVEALQRWRDAMEPAGASYVRTMVYLKSNPQPQLTGDRPGVGWEAMFVFWAGAARMAWNGGGRCGIYPATSEWGHGCPAPHPTTKPLVLMETLIRDFTDPGELVCDPFSGSGTTGVACKRLGRRFIGWEREPKYHAIAAKRIEAAREQLRFVIDELACEQLDLQTGERVDLDTMERVEG